MDFGTISMLLKLNIDNFSQNLKQVEKDLKDTEDKFSGFSKVGSTLESAGKKLSLGVTAPIVAAGTAGAKFATTFEEGMAKVNTLADTSQVSLDDLKKSVLDLSSESGQSTETLTEAMYQALSAGVKTTDVVDFLTVAVKDAKGGFTDTATAVDGLTNVLNAYGMSTEETTTLSNQMLITQNLGKTTFGELANCMGNVAPTANALNVSTKDLFASMAVLTANGVKTSEAATGLKAAFSNIIKPTSDAANAADALGINFSTSEVKAKGWRGFLGEIKDKMKECAPAYVENIEKQAELTTKMTELEKAGKKGSAEYKALAKELKTTKETGDMLAEGQNSQIAVFGNLFGSVEALNTVLTLTSDNGMQLFDKTLTEMETNTTAVDDAFETMSNTTASKFEETKQTFKNTLTSLGETLLPFITEGLGHINKLIQGFNNLSPNAQKTIMTIAGATATIGPLIVGVGKLFGAISSISKGIKLVHSGYKLVKGLQVMKSITKVVGVVGKLKGALSLLNIAKFLTSPVGLAVLAIGTLVTAGIVLYKNWDTVKEKAKEIGQKISDCWNSVCNWTKEAWGKVKQFVWDHLEGILTIVGGPLGGIAGHVIKHWDEIKQKTSEKWGQVKEFVKNNIITIPGDIANKLGEIKTGVVQKWEDIKQGTSEKWKNVKAYVKENVTSIPGDIKDKLGDVKDSVVSKWEEVKKGTSNKWKTVKESVKEHVSNIWPSIKDKVGGLGKSIGTKWEEIKNATGQKFTGIKDSIFKAFQTIARDTPNKIKNIKSKILSGFNFLKDLGKTSLTWGKDMIDGFVKGIKSGIAKVGEAAKSIGNKVKSYLHFSRPDEGPLREYEEWMPDFMEGLSTGIDDNKHKVFDSIKSLAQGMNLSNQLKLKPVPAKAYTGGSVSSIGSTGYQVNAPLLKVEHLYVRNDGDINKISRSIYNENMKVIRALGKRS